MTGRQVWTAIVVVLLLAGPAAAGQGSTLRSSEAGAFIGTWVFTMTNPQGAHETVRIWDKNGIVAASVQSGRFPPIGVSGILKDGDMLVLTVTRFENGKPDKAVISLTLDGETMKMAQMLEFSQTIKRGSGKKSADYNSICGGTWSVVELFPCARVEVCLGSVNSVWFFATRAL